MKPSNLCCPRGLDTPLRLTVPADTAQGNRVKTNPSHSTTHGPSHSQEKKHRVTALSRDANFVISDCGTIILICRSQMPSRNNCNIIELGRELSHAKNPSIPGCSRSVSDAPPCSGPKLSSNVNEQSLQLQIDGQYVIPVGPLLQSDNPVAKTYNTKP